MIGDDAMRHRLRPVGCDARGFGRSEHQGAERVGVVIIVLALQHRGDALDPHAGVDRGPRQVAPLARRHLLILHEHEIPYLDETVAIGVGAAGRTARNLVAVIVENLRARAAGTGLAHRPEIVRGGDADDLTSGQAGDLLPQNGRVLILGIDGDGELLLGDAVFLGHQIPGKLDRAILEVIAEREIAEHLEEGVMPGGVADILEVVMLAAGADAFLRRGGAAVGALLRAGEDVLELHHPRIGEEQGRIVARHERRGWHHLMAILREIVEEDGADIVGQHEPKMVLSPDRAKSGETEKPGPPKGLAEGVKGVKPCGCRKPARPNSIPNSVSDRRPSSPEWDGSAPKPPRAARRADRPRRPPGLSSDGRNDPG